MWMTRCKFFGVDARMMRADLQRSTGDFENWQQQWKTAVDINCPFSIQGFKDPLQVWWAALSFHWWKCIVANFFSLVTFVKNRAKESKFILREGETLWSKVQSCSKLHVASRWSKQGGSLALWLFKFPRRALSLKNCIHAGLMKYASLGY